jgi:endonuclease/exonuclease/phosphatase (EEP) superfamily protein YafD
LADRPARLVNALDGPGPAAGRSTARIVAWLRARLPALGWALTAAMGVLAASQALGFSWIPLLWTAQAFTPLLLAPAVPVAAIALVRRRWAAAVIHTGLACCLVVLIAPVVTASTERAPTSAPRLTIAQGNVFYRTDRPDEVAAAMVGTGADVLAMTEYSQPVADAFDAIDGLTDEYPYVVAATPGDRNGVGLWSRHPILEQRITRVGSGRAIDATIDVDGRRVRVVVVHPLPGTDGASLASWSDDLAAIRHLADPDDARSPTVIVGDFNATRWHPAFRDLLGDGWRSAHEELGDGWSRSWPSDLPGPPLVRIDHALVSAGVIPTAVHDVALPGSDHLGLVVELAIAP